MQASDLNGDELFNVCLAKATAVIKQLRDEHFANATPDSEWNVRDLVQHMLYELKWVPDILSGQTISQVGDKHEVDLAELDNNSDLSAEWQAAVDAADQAMAEVDLEDLVHVSYGTISVEEYLQEASNDQLIHAWDLGKAIGVPVTFDASTAEELYELMLPRREEMQANSLFAPAIDVPESTDIQTKLLALFGRRADWRAM